MQIKKKLVIALCCGTVFGYTSVSFASFWDDFDGYVYDAVRHAKQILANESLVAQLGSEQMKSLYAKLNNLGISIENNTKTAEELNKQYSNSTNAMKARKVDEVMSSNVFYSDDWFDEALNADSHDKKKQLIYMSEAIEELLNSTKDINDSMVDKLRLMDELIKQSNEAQGAVQAKQIANQIKQLQAEIDMDNHTLWSNLSSIYALKEKKSRSDEIEVEREIKSFFYVADPYDRTAEDEKLDPDRGLKKKKTFPSLSR